MNVDVTTGHIIDAAVQLHIRFGPGLLESVYRTLLAKELRRRGLQVEIEKTVSFEVDGILFSDGFRVDLLVEGFVVVELKSVEALAPVHTKQLLTYLRLMNLQVGLLLNFGGATLREGLRRVVNNYETVAPRSSPLPRLRVTSNPSPEPER